MLWCMALLSCMTRRAMETGIGAVQHIDAAWSSAQRLQSTVRGKQGRDHQAKTILSQQQLKHAAELSATAAARLTRQGPT
jgi:hypothetical protein